MAKRRMRFREQIFNPLPHDKIPHFIGSISAEGIDKNPNICPSASKKYHWMKAVQWQERVKNGKNKN